ncbi:MAG: cyclodeaminase/cyclohydrolase family protein [Pseudoramibacter sp.]
MSETKKMMSQSCEAFIDVLASKSPTPGGGGAAAMAGALGSALGMMYLNLSVGKPKYQAYEAEFQAKLKDLDAIKAQLLSCVDEDAEAFDPLAKAYRMPRETESERAAYERVLEAALYKACSVPEKIMNLCSEAMDVIEYVAEKGSVLAKSDAAAAMILCIAAMNAAHLNILINTASMKNRKEAEKITETYDHILMLNNIRGSEIVDQLTEEIRNRE